MLLLQCQAHHRSLTSAQGKREKYRTIVPLPLPDGVSQGGEFYARRGLGLCNAQLCTIMHDYAGCIATKTHRDCKQEGTWDCDPPQTDNTVKSAAAIYAYFGQKITLLSLIFRRWKNFIIRQNIFSSGSMCRCILLDKIVHDKYNNKLHWTRVGQTIMQNYAQLCTCIISPPPASHLQVPLGPRCPSAFRRPLNETCRAPLDRNGAD